MAGPQRHSTSGSNTDYDVELEYKSDYKLSPPFSNGSSPRGYQASPLAGLPHSFEGHDGLLLDPRQETRGFLQQDLLSPRLGRIESALWIAGTPRPARPLHRQRLMLRSVLLTESPDEHLCWQDHGILLKPLPEYLLDHEFWRRELCADRRLHRSACGFLLSYSWLVRHRSDLRIALQEGLLPPDVTWDAWTAFMSEVAANIDDSVVRHLERRYEYGELRLSRLNLLYRLGAGGLSISNAIHGFMPGSIRYKRFLERNSSIIVASFVYVTVVLSAMQVGLGTDVYEGNEIYHELSARASMAAIFAVLATVSMFAVYYVIHTLYTWVVALRHRHVVFRERRRTNSSFQ